MDDREVSFLDWLETVWQYPLPQHGISRATHWLTRLENPTVKNWLIRHFIRRFHVDMTEAAQPDPAAYPSFNTFFTRALRDDARPLASQANAIACPADGTVSQSGDIDHGHIFQAKGRNFSVLELLGGNAVLANTFAGGEFTTLYLSPRDYHRIHMPLDGTLTHMLHVPGRLFSVNPPSTRAVPNLFARNERVVTIFDTQAGPMAIVPVGALNVGSIEAVWAGEITPPRGRELQSWDYRDKKITLEKGAEMGRFNMGSTVILMFGRQRIRWEANLLPDAEVRMGQCIGTMIQITL